VIPSEIQKGGSDKCLINSSVGTQSKTKTPLTMFVSVVIRDLGDDPGDYSVVVPETLAGSCSN
jgi:hypothetical protein